jgi:hypothetical protein
LTSAEIVKSLSWMPYRAPWEIEERAEWESSAESFDRLAFAERALAMLGPPPRTTVAICPGNSRLRVEGGRTWGKPGERWAMLVVPNDASRRAIALAVAEIAQRGAPWALDVLFGAALE